MSDMKAVVLSGTPEQIAEAVRMIVGENANVSAVALGGISGAPLRGFNQAGSREEPSEEVPSFDEVLVQGLLADLHRRGFRADESQQPFLEYLFERHPRAVTAAAAAKALGVSTISLGGAVGGLGLRFQALARERGIRQKPGQIFLKFERVDRARAYRFTAEGYEAYRRFRSEHRKV